MTPEQVQDEIIEEFELFDNWMDRYQYLIDLGQKLPEMPPDMRVDANLLAGCQSRVWIVPQGDAERLSFAANSDSAIVSGLIALVMRVYSGHDARTILDTQPRFVDAIGLSAHLSPTRSNGLASMLQAIRNSAATALA